mmetsp:Transcript_18366/g.39489  ORF Transcript_18366/g.39489 Transcript_18366/m.39489 type:complete len:356 (-) Transcript_18366:623-1690(-)
MQEGEQEDLLTQDWSCLPPELWQTIALQCDEPSMQSLLFHRKRIAGILGHPRFIEAWYLAITHPHLNHALLLAAGRGVEEVALSLISKGAIPNSEVLEEAVRCRRPEMVRVLLEAGAPVGLWALHSAAKLGAADIVAMLLESRPPSPAMSNTPGADIAAATPLSTQPPAVYLGPALASAAAQGHLEVCKVLLQHGASATWSQSIPLAQAAASGNAELCRLLIQHGALATRDALLRVAKKGHVEVLELLLQAAQPPMQWLAVTLEHAAWCGKLDACEAILRYASAAASRVAAAGADSAANVSDLLCVSEALSLASSKGHGDVCRLLTRWAAGQQHLTEDQATAPQAYVCEQDHHLD